MLRNSKRTASLFGKAATTAGAAAFERFARSKYKPTKDAKDPLGMNRRLKKRKRTGSTQNENSRSTRVAGIRSTKNAKVTIKAPSKVRITKKFKAKVTKALEPMMSYGKYTESGCENFGFGTLFGNRQVCYRLGPNNGSGIGQGFCFSPAHVLDAASVLFNNKTATEGSKALQTGVTLNTEFGTGSFDPRITRITVKNQYYSFVLRNNTSRTWIIQMYECSPKKSQNFIEMGDPQTQWLNTFINEDANPAGDPAKKKINIGNININTLYATPKDTQAFLNVWNIEKHDIVLDPGQSYDHNMQGPTGVYDYTKYWRSDSAGVADQFFNIQPSKTRFVFFTARLDLVTNDDGTAARYGIAEAKQQLCMEYKMHYHLAVPEVAGGTISETGPFPIQSNFLLGQRRNCYYKRNWDETISPPTTRIEEQTAAQVI